MVPDVYHILIKNKGVFSNVASAAAKAKLRLLYECAPIALLIEAAGGARCVEGRGGKRARFKLAQFLCFNTCRSL